MTTVQIIEQVEQRFADVYNHFKELQQKPEYRPYWDKCVSISTGGYFMVKTASVYGKPRHPLEIKD